MGPRKSARSTRRLWVRRDARESARCILVETVEGPAQRPQWHLSDAAESKISKRQATVTQRRISYAANGRHCTDGCR